MSTRAIAVLKKAKIPFEVILYDHKEKGAVFAAQATGIPIEKTIKTLIADLGSKHYVATMLPGNKRLDLKKLAQQFRVKQAAMTDTVTAERLSGYKVGGISPFGLKAQLSSVLDRATIGYEQVIINAGKRGLMLKMAPKDIQTVLNCSLADISR